MKKVGFIVMILVLALGALGVGYAYWSDVLTINGNVATGSFNNNLVAVSASDSDGSGVGSVGTCTAVANGDKAVTVTIGNGYPTFVGTVNLRIDNTGSIPSRIKNLTYPALVDLDGDSVNDISVSLSPASIAEGTTVSAGGSKSGTLTVTVLDDATQSASGSFTVSMDAVQFNNY